MINKNYNNYRQLKKHLRKSNPQIINQLHKNYQLYGQILQVKIHKFKN